WLLRVANACRTNTAPPAWVPGIVGLAGTRARKIAQGCVGGDKNRSEMQNSGRFPAEIRHRVVQYAEDHGAGFTREALLQRRKPAAHRFERWTNRLGGNDALDADGGGRLLAREQDFLQALAGPDPSEGNVDVAPGFKTREPNHPLGEIDDLHRL